MFSDFCIAEPQGAKEMSTSFTKFARWMQSTTDKSASKQAA